MTEYEQPTPSSQPEDTAPSPDLPPAEAPAPCEGCGQGCCAAGQSQPGEDLPGEAPSDAVQGEPTNEADISTPDSVDSTGPADASSSQPGEGAESAEPPEPDNEAEPLICVRYGRMNQLGLFRSRVGPVHRDARVVIKSERGLEIGTALCAAGPKTCYEGRPLKRVGTIRRIATHDDLMEEKHLHQSEDRERKFCEQRIRERKLPMKLAAAEHLFGGDRIIFYFLSDGRVDFRDLVKDLAHEYQTRIEMRQIGVRDEARLLADYERCGQFICCRAFIKEFQPVSMRMAKVQKATLDPSKISGRCGRLMCCLRYENDTYDDLRKSLPKRNSYVLTEHGPGKVFGGDILTQLVKVDVAGKVHIVPVESIIKRDLSEDEIKAAMNAGPARRRSSGPGGRRDDRPSDRRRPDDRRRDRRPESDRPPAAAGAEAPVAEAAPTASAPDTAGVPAPDGQGGPAAGSAKRRSRRRRKKKPSGAGQQGGAGQGGSDRQGDGSPQGRGDSSSGSSGDLSVPRRVLEEYGISDSPDSGGDGGRPSADGGGSDGREDRGKPRRRGRRRRSGRRGGSGGGSSSGSAPGGGSSGGGPSGGGAGQGD